MLLENRSPAKRIIPIFLAVLIALCGFIMVPDMSYASTKVKIGQACGGNNGYGDGTGKEVCVGNWSYSSSTSSCYHWDYVFRFKDPAKAEKAADAMEAACLNDNIGYENATKEKSMSFTYAAMENNWNIAGISTKCGTACSQLVLTCVQAAGINSSSKNYAYSNSAGAASKLMADTSNFTTITDSAYLSGYTKLRRGDILISSKVANRHTCMVIENGINANCNLLSYMPTDDSVTLTWGKTAGASKYAIYMSSDGKEYSSVATTTALSYTYNVNSKYSNKTLYFKIRPYEGSSAGSYSIVVSHKIGNLIKPVAVQSGSNSFTIKMVPKTTNIRTGPSTKYKKAGTAKKNEIYKICKTKNDWGNIESTNNWIRLTNAVITSGYKVNVTIKTLNMRTGPSTKYKSKGKLKPGTYEVSKINGNWCYIKIKKLWVSRTYAKKI